MTKIFDCFTFYNELTLLQLRLETLYEHVDRFVIAEATHTFAGKPKPLYFQENKHLFHQYLDKVEHVIVNDMPSDTDAWGREIHQRNALIRGLNTAKPNDIIMLSDVDEIQNPPAIKQISPNKTTIFGMRMFYYFFNLELIHTQKYIENAKSSAFIKNSWAGTKTIPFQHLKTMQELRMTKARHYPWYRIDRKSPLILENAGWHFSYLAPIDGIMDKLSSFAHQELNTPEINNSQNIQQEIDRLIQGQEISFGAIGRYYGHKTPIDNSFPKALQSKNEAFSTFILS